MNPVGLVTGKAGLYIAGAAVALLAAALITQTFRLAASQTEVAVLEREAAAKEAAAQQAARIQTEKNRATEAQRFRDQQEAVDDAHSQAAAARADADALRDALGRLRQRAAGAERGPAGGDSAAAAGGAPAGPAAHLPPDVLSGLGEAAGQLAAYADAARIAGQTCERSYRALTEDGQ